MYHGYKYIIIIIGFEPTILTSGMVKLPSAFATCEFLSDSLDDASYTIKSYIFSDYLIVDTRNIVTKKLAQKGSKTVLGVQTSHVLHCLGDFRDMHHEDREVTGFSIYADGTADPFKGFFY